MRKKDVTLRINSKLWDEVQKKIEKDFGRKYSQTDCALIISLLALYKKNNKMHSIKNLYDIPFYSENIPDNCDYLEPENQIKKNICLYDGLIDKLKKMYCACNYSDAFTFALADFLCIPVEFYTDFITSLYSIIGSKNKKMQEATANAVENMQLKTENMVLIDGCCATGSLFFGLKTRNWKGIILNDMNPLRTNFLNVIKLEPLKLIKKLLQADLSFIKEPEFKNKNLSGFKAATDAYQIKRCHYTKVDCNIEIAYQMFLRQCIDKAMIEDSTKIFDRILRFLPAHLKLQHASITPNDCLEYLKNDFEKLVLLDVPYVGSEKECAIQGYQYDPFHKKVSGLLKQADFPFIYYCRSSAPKSDKSESTDKKERILKRKLGIHFYNKGFYFEKIHLEKDTELMISNRHYNNSQFQWINYRQDLR